VNPTSIPDKPSSEFPFGIIAFNISGLSSGQTVDVTITLPQNLPTNSIYWKFGKTVDNQIPHWYRIPFGSNDGDNIITIQLQDGGIGDDDLTVNGIIADDGGPSIDNIAPVTEINILETPGSKNWYTSDIHVTLSAIDDGGSGVNNTEYSTDGANWIPSIVTPVTFSNEGITEVFYRSTDNAGNVEATKNQTIKIDKAPPVITGNLTTPYNAYGWYNSDVIARFNCVDTISGSVNSSFDVFVFLEGANQSVNGTCSDNAGNNASLTVTGINIDKTAPTVAASSIPDPNAYGWNNGTFNVTFTATDNLSGIDGTPIEIISMNYEGANQSVSRTFTDKAGNSASGSISGINIDLTPPNMTGAPTTPPNAKGWYNTDVTVKFNSYDILSGIDSVTPDIIISTEGANQSVTGTAGDKAGNLASYTVSGINIDKTVPIINSNRTPVPNANGWNNGNVTVHFECSDGLSGLEGCPADILVPTEGVGQSVSAALEDIAGNSAAATVNGINIDRTPPGISISGVIDGGHYNYNVTPVIIITDTNLNTQTVMLNGAPYTSGNVVSTEGNYTLVASADDLAGNNASMIVNFVIDRTPPEAAISFNISSKDIKVYSNENRSEINYTVLPQKKDRDDDKKSDDEIENGWELRQYTLKDLAGNLFELGLKHKKEGKEVKVKVISMQYNGGTIIDAAKNEMQVEYAFGKSSSLKEFEQKIEVKKQFDAEAKYSFRENKTEIKVKVEGQKELKETRAGIVIFGIMTERGSLNLTFKDG